MLNLNFIEKQTFGTRSAKASGDLPPTRMDGQTHRQMSIKLVMMQDIVGRASISVESKF